ncbi:pantetheine-phosphate adenylyltransferase [Peptostreptococcus sp. D1]|uniref:pantetheine-phosphate adenylyltransferase n=1 Tax=Peptostreptococcus sp. D1 TaxID=72304 RepID=UPI0008E25FCD|nr:pantetheine-phosphate adenylyltransferase [Peptostreptococcus sp. D1]SFE48597.1 Phosphopantetheine adenylyltransferase [Peptostreptococcus sp. D1]
MSKPVKAIFAGSFDPITNGHIDIIERASRLFDKLIIGILINPNKKTMFTISERIELIRKSTEHIENIEVISFEGLLVDYCKKNDVSVLVRGIRSTADVEYELRMAHMNKELANEIETIILPTSTKYSYISSSLIKEVLSFDADIENLVPKCVLDELRLKKK